MQVAHPLAALAAIGRQRNGAVLKTAVLRPPTPFLLQGVVTAVFLREPVIEERLKLLLKNAASHPLLHHGIEFQAVFVEGNNGNECRIANGRNAGIGIDLAEEGLLKLQPVIEACIRNLRIDLEVALEIPSVLIAAIGSAGGTQSIHDPVDAVSLQRSHEIMDAIQHLRVEIEILGAVRHQRGVDIMETGDVVAVPFELQGIAVGSIVIRKPARRRA